MAAEIFLGPIVNVTLSKVISLATQQLNFGVGYKKELETFCTKLKMINGVLLHAEQKEATGAPGVKIWLQELRKIVDEADAVVDEIAYESFKQKLKQVSSFFTSSNPLAVRLRMARMINNLNVALTELNKAATELGLQHILANNYDSVHRELIQQTDSLLGDPSGVIGRETDALKIVSMLIESDYGQPLGVVSVVGVGGLGKTTLAKLVCNNEKVRGHFFKIVWVCVSEKFDVPSILGEMLQSLARGSRMDITNQDTVVQLIKQKLDEKNFLLVLDDVWSVDEQRWRNLSDCLLGMTKNVRSSRVLVTTRLPRVASMMRSNPGTIKLLKDNDCWSIIKQKAFGNVSVPSELEAIGKKIAVRCRGVPLVANALGGTLYNNRNKDDWLSIEKNFDATDDAGVLRALKLSFDRLPRPALKQCFAFCSIFIKDFVIEKKMLIQLWMAEGFLKPLDSSLEMEDIGDNYFADLVSCSFFQDLVWDSYGSVISCKMHDFMHDLAKSVSGPEMLVVEDGRQCDITDDIRNLILISAPSMGRTKMMGFFSKVHTLFSTVDMFGDLPVNFKGFLVLSFGGADISELPSFLGKLKRLRYLDISETQIKEIPKFINKLYLLQTLRFMDCKFLEKAPRIGNLVSLKHIYFNDEKHMPVGIGSLTCLQTLQLFAVDRQKGCQIQELEYLNLLSGKLKIRNLENVRDEATARRARLYQKTAIKELTLEFGSSLLAYKSKHHSDILEGLKPHSSLKGLVLEYYRGQNCPSGMSETWLQNLFRMQFHDCPYLESIPPLPLSNKAEVDIQRCKNLKSISVSSLQYLTIVDCGELVLLQFGPLALTSLTEMKISWCPKLESLPMVSNLSSLEILELRDCYNLRNIGESLSSCACLKELCIQNCPYLPLPNLRGLSNLSRIYI